MISNKWIDFTLHDLTNEEDELFTQDYFEKSYQDKFEAMEIDEQDNTPIYIWCKNNVYRIVSLDVLWGDTFLTKAPRNPNYK
jgi:hypothetical protein